MRHQVIKILDQEKVTEIDKFARIVNAAEQLVKTLEKIPDKKKGVMQRIKVLMKKYQDNFDSTEDYQRLSDLLSKFK